jgi:aminopeptidase N
MAGIFGQINGMYAEDAAHRAVNARFAFAKLEPAMTRLGWTPRADEPANDAVLRTQLIGTLGELGHPATLAEANRRFAANDPSVQAGPLRSTILAIVAYNADEATWERLRRMARDERSPQVRVDLYRLLGGVKDETLARRALDLALTDEVGATNASQIFGAVAGEHPDLAFDYAVAHREQVDPLVDASSRSRFFARLGGGSADPAMVGKLNDYATRYLTPQSRGEVDRAIASVTDRLRVRRERLPQITRWLEAWRA